MPELGVSELRLLRIGKLWAADGMKDQLTPWAKANARARGKWTHMIWVLNMWPTGQFQPCQPNLPQTMHFGELLDPSMAHQEKWWGKLVLYNHVWQVTRTSMWWLFYKVVFSCLVYRCWPYVIIWRLCIAVWCVWCSDSKDHFQRSIWWYHCTRIWTRGSGDSFQEERRQILCASGLL